MSNKIQGLDGLYTPEARLVMGSTTERVTKDAKNQPIPPEKQPIFMGLALPKTDPVTDTLLRQMFQMAMGHYGQMPMVAAQIQQGLGARDFSWKIDDGDVPLIDQQTGMPKEIADYRRGCYIFKFSTLYQFGACDANNDDINPAQIKKGDYVDLMFNAAPNGNNDHTAGIYLNPVAIRLIRPGDPIASGVQASSAFAGRPAANGVAPAAGAMPMAGGMAPAPATGAPAPAYAPPAAAPAPAPATYAPPPAAPLGNPAAPAPMQPAPAAGAMHMAGGQPPAQAGTAYPTEPHSNILQPPTGAAPAAAPAPAAPTGGGMPGV